MRINLSVKHWLNIVCVLVLLPFSHLSLSNFTILDRPAAWALIDENGHAEIPNTYTSIGADAFKDSDLKSVTIPDGITNIGDNAFSSTQLTSIEIPNSVVTIEGSAFAWTYSLTSLTLGNSLQTIESSAFYYSGITNLIIPDSVTSIGSFSFYESGLESLTIGNSVTSIGGYAFSDSNDLQDLVIGSSVTFVGNNSFTNTNITSLVIPESVTSISNDAFRNVPIGNLVIGSNVTTIGDDAFSGVNGDVFILKPAQENFDIYNFTSMANVYACDSLDDAGNPQDCADAWPDDGIDVPEWPINICDSDSSLPECDPCTLDPDACDPCAINLEMCEDPCAYDAQSCDPCISDPDSCTEVPDLMTQNISVTNNPKGILGKTAVLEVSYDTSDSNNQLTGIGMRVHFNSSLLGFKEITNLIEQDIIVSGDGPHNDEDDFDNDPLTDQYISFGWASLFGNWPNVELPIVLMNIAFDVFDTIDTDAIAETNINFSKTAFTVGYEFEAENYNLELKTASWDFDGNGHADALTDGLMMLRYCFGLRGDSVTTSAMAIDSPMSSEQVVAEIESALDMADIDDDGEVGALTDGLILLRYLFGLRADQLTAATVSLTANRSSNEAIEAYIEAYMP